MTDTPVLTPAEKATVDAEAMERATAILARTMQNPLEVAKENAELRSSIKGAYALMHVMVKRLGGETTPIVIPFAEHADLDDSLDLQVARAKNGDVTLRLHKPNRAERRARK